jgi:hypothetical protein
MVIREKFTDKVVKLEFEDLAFGMLCCINRNKQFANNNMQGCYYLPGFFEWLEPSEYEKTLSKWSVEYSIDLLDRATYVKGLSPFTSK